MDRGRLPLFRQLSLQRRPCLLWTKDSKPRVSPTSSSTLTAIAAVLNSLSSVPVPSGLATNSRVRSRHCLLVPSFLCHRRFFSFWPSLEMVVALPPETILVRAGACCCSLLLLIAACCCYFCCLLFVGCSLLLCLLLLVGCLYLRERESLLLCRVGVLYYVELYYTVCLCACLASLHTRSFPG